MDRTQRVLKYWDENGDEFVGGKWSPDDILLGTLTAALDIPEDEAKAIVAEHGDAFFILGEDGDNDGLAEFVVGISGVGV